MLGSRNRHALASEDYRDRDRTLELLGFRTYSGYIRSRLWKIVRERALEIHGRLCRRCGRPANQVHHASYTRETLIGEDILGLVPVCGSCHRAASLTPRRSSERLLDGIFVRPLAETNQRLARKKEAPTGQKLKHHFCACGRARRKNKKVCRTCRDKGLGRGTSRKRRSIGCLQQAVTQKPRLAQP